MRRALTTLTVLLAAAPLTLAAPWPATAADAAPGSGPGPRHAAGRGDENAVGELLVETDRLPRTKLVRPKPGCYVLPRFPLLSLVTVTNGTNADAIIYSGENCKPGFLRPASRVRAGTISRHTLTGTYSLLVDQP
ncbi:hypothetical protein DQ384_39650 [Sphaerisporangium album]|uniref:Secreted protein n=1 Tax=Sphaerisporangium album TaxID=509200 RepID=A0A367EI76_9ACTN|nr:hypothetical protein [Sphaerisporangium album]RCG17774.1 hypothetical protein DQ384_39650 [Sphaerisporangium album]